MHVWSTYRSTSGNSGLADLAYSLTLAFLGGPVHKSTDPGRLRGRPRLLSTTRPVLVGRGDTRYVR
jgi:hypothetical protein